MARTPREPAIKPQKPAENGKIRFACDKCPGLWFGHDKKLYQFKNGIIDVDEDNTELINKIKSISKEYKISYPKPKEEIKENKDEA